MGRDKRVKSVSGIYHIYVCGINKQNIFHDDDDREYFINILRKNKSDFMLLAYCLLTNSTNLLIKENNMEIPVIMQKILTTYASYFNRKYKRTGSLFENRYKRIAVREDEVYDVVNLIHKLPKNYVMYKWSSYQTILNKDELCDFDFSGDYEKIHAQKPEKGFNPAEAQEVKYKQLSYKLNTLLNGIEAESIGSLPKKERDEILKMLRENGFTIGQLMRLTGISRSIITRSNKVLEAKKQDREIQVFLL